MILSDREIKAALEKGVIKIEPLPPEGQFTTSALDLRFGDELFELKTQDELKKEEPPGVERPLVVDLMAVDIRELLRRYARPVSTEADGSFVLHPGKFALGITHERIQLPLRSKIAARVEGRSTLARLGLVVHFTAPTIHAGFEGAIVLEMYNFGSYPMRLRPRELAVCQLVFERLGHLPAGPLKTRHQRQRSVR